MEVISIPTKNEEYITTVVKIDEVTPILKLSEEFEKKGFPNESIKCLKHLFCVSNSFYAHTAIGNVYYRTNDLIKAKNEYLEALLDLNEEHDSDKLFEIYKNLGNISLKENKVSDAKNFYEKAALIKSDSSDLFVNMATLDLIQQDEDSAIEKFRKAIYKNDKNDKAWVGLALIYQNYGESDLTLACLKKALDLNQYNINALHLYSEFCNKNEKRLEAIEFLENWILKNDFHSDVYSYLIELYINNNNLIRAKELLEIALLWEPKNNIFIEWYDAHVLGGGPCAKL